MSRSFEIGPWIATGGWTLFSTFFLAQKSIVRIIVIWSHLFENKSNETLFMVYEIGLLRLIRNDAIKIVLTFY